MFWSKSKKPAAPLAVPPVISPAPGPVATPPSAPRSPAIQKTQALAIPPVIPQQPRLHHQEFTHEFLPDAYLGEKRAGFIGLLTTNKLEENMKAGWVALGMLHGPAAIPLANMHVSAFRHESCLCGFFHFPPAVRPKEAIAALVIAGPAEKWPPLDLATLRVRYFVLERTDGPLTLIKEHTAKGFVEAGFGPNPRAEVHEFTDLVFGLVFGRKGPSAQDAAKRLLILRHLLIYAQATQYGKAMHAHPHFSVEAKADLHSVMGGMFSDTLRKENLWEYVSNKEKAFFETPVQNLSQQDVINASWRREALETLKWALNLMPNLPPYDTEASDKSFSTGGSGGAADFVARAQLRDQKQIEYARDVAELWHWRSRTRQLQEENRPLEPSDDLKKGGIRNYTDIIRMTAQAALKEGDIGSCINDDFPAFGKAYRDLNADEWSRVRSITMERHFTLNWLCGYSIENDWDSTPTHT